MTWDQRIRKALAGRLKDDSLTAIAEASGLTRPMLSAYHHGHRGLSSGSLERLARVLGLDLAAT